MPVHVFSIDFDGCLHNTNVAQVVRSTPSAVQDSLIVTHNQLLVDFIRENLSDSAEAYTIVGSNRQSFQCDVLASGTRYTESCYNAMQVFSQSLGVTLDTFLLADSYGDLPVGTSFARAQSDMIETGRLHPNHYATSYNVEYYRKLYENAAIPALHSTWNFDSTKATLIYAQAHYFANRFPNEPITLDFFDDHHMIIEPLKNIYLQHPELLPANVTLRIHQYQGYSLNNIAEIQGTGIIDNQFDATIKEVTQPQYRSADGSYPCADYMGDVVLKMREEKARVAQQKIMASPRFFDTEPRILPDLPDTLTPEGYNIGAIYG